MVKVRATKEYEKNNIVDKELNRTPKEGEIFEISNDRLDTLTGNNAFNLVFVEVIEEKKKETPVVEKKAFIKANKTNVKKTNIQE